MGYRISKKKKKHATFILTTTTHRTSLGAGGTSRNGLANWCWWRRVGRDGGRDGRGCRNPVLDPVHDDLCDSKTTHLRVMSNLPSIGRCEFVKFQTDSCCSHVHELVLFELLRHDILHSLESSQSLSKSLLRHVMHCFFYLTSLNGVDWQLH